MTDSRVDLDLLERLATAATPGPWKWCRSYLMQDVPGETNPYCTPCGHPIADDGSAGGEYRPAIDTSGADATYIVAAAPPAMLALIAELREARDKLEVSEAVHRAYVAGEAHATWAGNKPGPTHKQRAISAEFKLREARKALVIAERWIDDHATDEPAVRGGILLEIRRALATKGDTGNE